MGNKYLKTIVSYLVLSSIFLLGKEIGLGSFTIRWYHFIYLPVLVWGIIFYRKVNVRLIIIFLLILIYSCLTYVYGLPLVFKQFVNIAFSCFTFYFFLAMEEFKIEEVLRKYINVAKVVLIIGFIQVLLFLTDRGDVFISVFTYLIDTNITFRFQSLSQEPSYIAYTFAPVVLISIYNLFNRPTYFIGRAWSLLFIAGYVLTFSLIGYLGLILMILLLTFRNYSSRKLIISFLAFVVIIGFSVVIYKNVGIIRVKVDQTIDGLYEDPIEYTKKDTNLSTFTFLANFYVTRKNFEEYPIAGTGLGTYEITYERVAPVEVKEYSRLNDKDAGSMGFRLIAETGLIGLGLFLFFLIKYKVRSRRSDNIDAGLFWIINSGIFVMIVLELIRDGNYTNHGKFLFILLYYFTYIFVTEERKSLGNESLKSDAV